MPQKDNISTVPTPQNSGEIVLYQPDNDIRIEVRLEKDTVWLTQQQIADLFGVRQPAISKHIANIYKSGELNENSTYSILEYMGNDGKQLYTTKVYNLDMILSVGYRVNSINATRFRQWANSVLKKYLLEGQIINQQLLAMQRQIDSRFERQDNRMLAIEKELADHREKIDFFVRTNIPPVEQVFFNGQFFEARSLLERMVKTAQKRVIIIDPYIDAATFEILDVRQKGVSADIYSSNEHTALRNAHNAAANVEPINTHLWSNPSHDRWLIIDDNLFLCGHSLKDMGKKLTAIMLIETKPEVVLNVVV
ncbi:MAG: virulence RhuM family protein [Bacteroidales bacterium]|nr:virulence RhuM family protein [Bacteroidales bacterium]